MVVYFAHGDRFLTEANISQANPATNHNMQYKIPQYVIPQYAIPKTALHMCITTTPMVSCYYLSFKTLIHAGSFLWYFMVLKSRVSLDQVASREKSIMVFYGKKKVSWYSMVIKSRVQVWTRWLPWQRSFQNKGKLINPSLAVYLPGSIQQQHIKNL